MQYAQDYDEILPTGTDDSPAGPWGASWAGRVNAYVKSPALYHCPDDSTGPVGSAQTSVALSYNYNRSIPFTNPGAGFHGPAGTLAGLNSRPRRCCCARSRVTRSTSPPTMIPHNDFNINQSIGLNGVWQAYPTITTWTSSSSPAARRADAAAPGSNYGGYIDPSTKGRHTDGSNFLLADGHVKWYRGSAVSSGFAALKSTDPQDTQGRQCRRPRRRDRDRLTVSRSPSRRSEVTRPVRGAWSRPAARTAAHRKHLTPWSS